MVLRIDWDHLDGGETTYSGPQAGRSCGDGRRTHGRALGLRVNVYHMNETHGGAADAGAARKPDGAGGRRTGPPRPDIEQVRKCVFTTHTPCRRGTTA